MTRRSWPSQSSGQRMCTPSGGRMKSVGVWISMRCGSTWTEADESTGLDASLHGEEAYL